jgi:hypothetical protein
MFLTQKLNTISKNKSNLKNHFVIITFTLALLSGCSSTPKTAPLPIISENDALSFESKLLSEYEQIKLNKPVEKSIIKWVQPVNKKESCKVFIKRKNNNQLSTTHKIYWDGKCKNGYANGLGREFERDTLENMNAIALYNGEKKEPKYFQHTYNLNGASAIGDINNNYISSKIITDDKLVFNIVSMTGYFDKSNNYSTFIASSPFSKRIMYVKNYPNFSYNFFKNNSEFGDVIERISMKDKKGNYIGYMLETLRDGSKNHYEMTEHKNKVKRFVRLPKSYIEKMLAIKSEIIKNAKKASIAEKSANIAIKQYMLTICKNSASVAFIDDTEYKKICENSDYNTNLRIKIKEKFAEISKINKDKREKINQDKLINEKIRQTEVAKRNAEAAKRASSFQLLQSINQISQMQQLNRNLQFINLGL